MKTIKIAITTLFTLAALLTASLSQAQPERFLPGRDYTVIDKPAPDRTPGLIEVTEYFWYGCPACYQFEAQLSQWIQQQAEDVVCLRLPALWDAWREVHARAHYTALSLGVLDRMHPVLFDTMHREGNYLHDEQAVMAVFAAHGVNEADFSKTYNSFTVSTDIKRARALSRQYQAHATPSLIVNGKYLVNLSRSTLPVVDFLVQRERMQSD